MSCKNTKVRKVINLSTQLWDIAKTAYSFPGVVLSLNNNKYLSGNVSILLIAAMCGGNLLHTKYKETSLKYGLFIYSTCIPFNVSGKCVPFNIVSSVVYFIVYPSLPVKVDTFTLNFWCQPVCAIQVIAAIVPWWYIIYPMDHSLLLWVFFLKSIFRSGLMASTYNGWSSIFGGWYAGVIMDAMGVGGISCLQGIIGVK